MTSLAILSFLFLTLSFVSLWIRRDLKVWGALLGLSLFCAFLNGNVSWIGLTIVASLTALWFSYAKKPSLPLFLLLVIASICFKLRLFPGFQAVFITPKFHVRWEGAIIGLLPLALVVPLARTPHDWKNVMKGLVIGCAGIGLLAILATIGKVTQWDFKLPSFMATRVWSNLFLTSIPEEGFYRGFLQKGLSHYFHNTKKGKIAALLITSVIFTLAHIYWSPNVAVLGFVFLASLLYGGVYLISGKIESAILCHFLLNIIHMTFFEYHAM